MRDRLEELHHRMKDISEEKEADNMGCENNISAEPQAVLFEEEPELEDFLKEVQHIHEAINELDGEVRKFSQQQRTLVAAMRRFSVMKKESSVARDIKLRAEAIYRKLEELGKKTDDDERNPNSAFVRICHTQHNGLLRLFRQVMRDYNASLLTKQDKCKEFIKRQLEVSGRQVSEEEVEEMLAQGHWEVFNENVLHESKITRAQLSEIEQRHKELLTLEGNMRDLRELFLEVFMLVEEQGQHIENIQANVEKTKDYVAETSERFKRAVKYRKRNPLRRICCFCCPWYNQTQT